MSLSRAENILERARHLPLFPCIVSWCPPFMIPGDQLVPPIPSILRRHSSHIVKSMVETPARLHTHWVNLSLCFHIYKMGMTLYPVSDGFFPSCYNRIIGEQSQWGIAHIRRVVRVILIALTDSGRPTVNVDGAFQVPPTQMDTGGRKLLFLFSWLFLWLGSASTLLLSLLIPSLISEPASLSFQHGLMMSITSGLWHHNGMPRHPAPQTEWPSGSQALKWKMAILGLPSLYCVKQFNKFLNVCSFYWFCVFPTCPPRKPQLISQVDQLLL